MLAHYLRGFVTHAQQSVKAIAAHCGCSTTTVSKHLSGVALPPWEFVAALAEACTQDERLLDRRRAELRHRWERAQQGHHPSPVRPGAPDAPDGRTLALAAQSAALDAQRTLVEVHDQLHHANQQLLVSQRAELNATKVIWALQWTLNQLLLMVNELTRQRDAAIKRESVARAELELAQRQLAETADGQGRPQRQLEGALVEPDESSTSVDTADRRVGSPVAESGEVSHHDSFRDTYLDYLRKVLDRVEIFGLDTYEGAGLPVALSAAYVSLTTFVPTGEKDWVVEKTLPIEGIVSARRRILLRGEAGSGKTTLLQFLAVSAARGSFSANSSELNKCVPFIVRLRSYYDRMLPTPEEFVPVTLSAAMPAGWVHRCLRSGDALLLIDGVDEIPKSQRRYVRLWLSELLLAYPRVRAVATSRPVSVAASWLAEEGFFPVSLDPMAWSQVRQFVHQWHAARGHAWRQQQLEEAEQTLLALFDARPNLRGLASTPLLCAVLCTINLERRGYLPTYRMELFEAITSMLLERRDVERSVAVRSVGLPHGRRILADIAWRMMQSGSAGVSTETMATWVDRVIASMPEVSVSADQVVEYLVERSGVVRSPEPGRFEFVHRLFLEYFAATAAADGDYIDVVVAKAHQDLWREVAIFTCGLAVRRQREHLLSGILDRAALERRHARKLRLLAVACLETSLELSPDLRQRVEQVIGSYLVPPRTFDDARSLASLGSVLLRYMPTTLAGLTAAKARSSVACVAATGDMDALSVLARYAADPRPEVQRELIRGWRYFSPARYVEAVLADAPLVGGELVVDSTDQLRHVGGLRELRRLVIHLPDHEPVFDLGFLRELPQLRELVLGGLDPSCDLTPLASLSGLRVLALVNFADRHRLPAMPDGVLIRSSAEHE